MSNATTRAGIFWSVMAFALVVVAAALGAPPAHAAPGHTSAPMQIATEGITYEEYTQWQAELNRWLSGETPSATFANPVRVPLTRADIDSVERAPRWESPMRIGVTKPIAPAIAIEGLSRGGTPRADLPGVLEPTADGGLVWAIAVRSDDAGMIRLHLERMSLPAGAALYVYSRGGQAFGPYIGEGPGGDGDFWTTAVFGTEAVVQVRIPAGADDADLHGLAFRITEAGLVTANFAAGFGPRPTAATRPPTQEASFCGNAACLVDATCYSSPADPEKLAAAKMEWVQGAYIYTCTGGLINDSNPSQNNFFLTANHCLSKNNTASKVTFYWRFATSTCNGTCPSNNGWPYQTTGATVAASGRKGDFTLLHLNSNPPAGSVFLGWTSTPVANTNNTPLYRVSNPDFGPQVYSQHNVSTTAGTCSGWPRGERIYSKDQTGAIDGGSSGSPVLNGSGQIVGQLSGVCGTNVNDPCDAANNATVDGAFAFYFSTVQPILAP
jgi:V8-like Glu-specific endopeptidase